MLVNKIFYAVKPLVPRWLQLSLRSALVRAKLQKCQEIWPIDPSTATPPEGWTGWPGGKRFALVLTHDVDTLGGHNKCEHLMALEADRGFRSSFNFVPERYPVSPDLREKLVEKGFEVGVHGLNHDGKLYSSRRVFSERAQKINGYLREWGAVGFRSPAMHHNLDWIHELDIAYDASTFDTDPFEPQSDAVGTIFPFWVRCPDGRRILEIPYTLPQDFTLFVLFRDKTIDTWKRKLEWIAEVGGVAVVNVHPDYMNFENRKPQREEYPARYYAEFLEHVASRYSNDFWPVLPRDLTRFYMGNCKEEVCCQRSDGADGGYCAGAAAPVFSVPGTAALLNSRMKGESYAQQRRHQNVHSSGTGRQRIRKEIIGFGQAD